MAERRVQFTKKELQEMLQKKNSVQEKAQDLPNENNSIEEANSNDTIESSVQASDVSVKEANTFTMMDSDYDTVINLKAVATDVATLCNVEQLLNTVLEIEMQTYKRTLPVQVYGISDYVLTSDDVHEIVQFDGINFLSNKTSVVDAQVFKRLIEDITVQLTMDGKFVKDMISMTVFNIDDTYVRTPFLLVNTYEYNALRKVFSNIAEVSLTNAYSVDNKMQLCIICKEPYEL